MVLEHLGIPRVIQTTHQRRVEFLSLKKEIRESYIERKIQDVWKYDLDKNGVINVNEYRKLLEDEWDDNPKNG